MLGKIADRKDRLLHMERKLAALDRTRLGKEVRSIVSLRAAGGGGVLICCLPQSFDHWPRIPFETELRAGGGGGRGGFLYLGFPYV